MPVIEVKSSDLLTQSTLNFATSTLQTDIVSIAKGEADEKLSQYQNTVLNLIASDQNIELGGLAPGISAIADSMSLDEDSSASINLLANDSYLGSASISITIGSASNGSTSVTAEPQHAPQIQTLTERKLFHIPSLRAHKHQLQIYPLRLTQFRMYR